MGYFNVGGGLAVDYDGSHTNFASSCNYGPDEYAADLVEVVMSLADQAEVAHPVLVSESGRALVAYDSVLVFNILDVARFERKDPPLDLSASPHEPLQNLDAVGQGLHARNVQESFHDALYYRDELRALFQHGGLSLRERAEGERLFWSIVVRIARLAEGQRYVPEELGGLHHALADVYYGNFSLFQSLPDAWAIDQLFPVMPIHRLNEEPSRQGILADITCDCDGKIDRFIDLHDVRRVLPLHELKDGEDYLLGVFLVGAYQETLGDLHNLFGDTNVVGIRFDEEGEVEFTRIVEGDTVADVLSYVEYDARGSPAPVRGDGRPCRGSRAPLAGGTRADLGGLPPGIGGLHLLRTLGGTAMGKVLIIGAGGVGGVVAHKCAQVPEVFEEICLASRTLAKCEAMRGQVSPAHPTWPRSTRTIRPRWSA